MTVLVVICGYLILLLGLGLGSNRFFRGTSKDFFVASHSIGPFLLLMSVFGTTMTAFALVGSTGKSFERGIGTYGLMASISCLVHAACFFLIGVRIYAHGRRNGYVTQIQFFRDRFESNGLGYLLFPILVLLVVPYLLIGIIGAGKTILPVTAGAFPDFALFDHPVWDGGIPPWLSGLVVCGVVLAYVFAGGSRGAAWANTFQTLVFMLMGLVAFGFIMQSLGGLEQAGKVPAFVTEDGRIVQRYGFDKEQGKVVELDEPKVVGRVLDAGQLEKVKGTQPHYTRTPVEIGFKKKNLLSGELTDARREVGMAPGMFLSYLFIPLSVGMFPHLFQHWLTARNARSFRLTVVAHPIFIMIVWVPCVLIGTWATGLLPLGMAPAAVLSNMLKMLVGNPALTGLLTAGVLAAIMSSLDSQFLCLGTIFTNDIVLHGRKGPDISDARVIWIARAFIVGIVALTYGLALVAQKANVFDLAVWCFSGFASLTPLVFAALYWKGATRLGAYASVVAAMAVWLVLFWKSGWGGEYLVGGVMPVTWSFAAGVVGMVLVSQFTPKPSSETLRKFFPGRG